MRVEVDRKSGFCFGVVKAISKAESGMDDGGPLYCLGEIVHNEAEVGRLTARGLTTISREQFFTLKNCRVLIRAHGEPPETYEYASANNIELLDATCPIVYRIQKKVADAWKKQRPAEGQVVIFGKRNHAEVLGLNGQTGHQAIVVEHAGDLAAIDPTKPVVLFSQTTKSPVAFREVAEAIRQLLNNPNQLEVVDTVCRQVSNRGPHLENFARRFDVVVFVAGRKSSNGTVLFQICQNANPRSYFISEVGELQAEWFTGAETAGVCGATSTPLWQMEEVAAKLRLM